ncbi:hypothetical protein LTR66_001979 [Elasticomyces elasticus]|nr:hypothetical protein LTR66_001979 [Elasticomyces elasticus]
MDYDPSGVPSTSNGVLQNAGSVTEHQATADSRINFPRSPIHVEGAAPQAVSSLSNNHSSSSQPHHQHSATTETSSFQGLLSPANGDHLEESPPLNYEDMTVEQHGELTWMWTHQRLFLNLDVDSPEAVPQSGYASDQADPANSAIGLAITRNDQVENLSSSVPCGVARFWYGKASDKNPTVSRLYHHLAILARPNVLQQLYFYARSLSSVLPFLNARDSILTLFGPVLGRRSPAPSTRPDCSNACFVKAQGLIFRGASVDELDVSFTEYSSQLDKLGLVGSQFTHHLRQIHRSMCDLLATFVVSTLPCRLMMTTT